MNGSKFFLIIAGGIITFFYLVTTANIQYHREILGAIIALIIIFENIESFEIGKIQFNELMEHILTDLLFSLIIFSGLFFIHNPALLMASITSSATIWIYQKTHTYAVLLVGLLTSFVLTFAVFVLTKVFGIN